MALSETDELPPKPTGKTRVSVVVSGLLIAALLLYFGPALIRPTGSGGHHSRVGEPLPEFSLIACAHVDQDYSTTQAIGKVTLINVWGTWCPPCREEFPHLMQLRAARQNKPDFQFISVVSGAGSDEVQELRSDVMGFLQAMQVTLPVYCDPNTAARLRIAAFLQAEDFAYPTSLVVDRKGIVRGVWLGFRSGDQHDMARLIDQLLAEKS
ncbi:MAG: TlpA family protein disulfide reductase [Planctomycetota bacterium]